MTNTTVAINAKDNVRLTQFCNLYNLQKKEFFKVALDYFEKHGIDPSKHSDSKSELEKITKRIDQLFGFIKTQEKDYLRPSVQSIVATEIRLKEQIGKIVLKENIMHLPSKNFIDSVQSNLKESVTKILQEHQKQLQDINKNVVASHKKISTELDEIKKKKGFLF